MAKTSTRLKSKTYALEPHATQERGGQAKSKVGLKPITRMTRSAATTPSGRRKAIQSMTPTVKEPSPSRTRSGGKKASTSAEPKKPALSPAGTVSSHGVADTHLTTAGKRGRDGHRAVNNQELTAAAFPDELLQDYIIYRQLQNALVRVGNQIEAIKKYDPLNGALLPLNEMRLAGKRPYKETEKRIVAAVRTMPIWTWAKDIRGVAENSLGQLLGETGDITKYSTVSKLWKRMGLGLVNGHRQQNWAANRKGFTKSENIDMATEMGYSARRRSLMHVIGSNLIRAKNKEYSAIYQRRKELELTKLPDKDPITGKKNKSKKSHAHRRALRYMEKAFLKALWIQWRAIVWAASRKAMPAAVPQRHAAD